MASPTRWTWAWASCRRQWRTEEPGVLQAMGSQRIGHDWASEQNKERPKTACSFPPPCEDTAKKGCLQASKRALSRSRPHSSSGLRPPVPRLWENQFLLKPPSTWYFIMAAWADRQTSSKSQFKKQILDFPALPWGSPCFLSVKSSVFKILCFHRRGLGPIPGQRTKTPHAVQPSQKASSQGLFSYWGRLEMGLQLHALLNPPSLLHGSWWCVGMLREHLPYYPLLDVKSPWRQDCVCLESILYT